MIKNFTSLLQKVRMFSWKKNGCDESVTGRGAILVRGSASIWAILCIVAFLLETLLNLLCFSRLGGSADLFWLWDFC